MSMPRSIGACGILLSGETCRDCVRQRWRLVGWLLQAGAGLEAVEPTSEPGVWMRLTECLGSVRGAALRQGLAAGAAEK